MSDSWSGRIAERYQCALAPALADWFDCEIWRQTGLGEFREPVDPATLITPAPEPIWPGLMSCDLIPLVSNTAGDWLCVRVDRQNIASEMVQWYHGGGDWIPWGKDIAEAIVFDAVTDRFTDLSLRHAIPAESPRPNVSRDQAASDPLLRWAMEQLPPSISQVLQPQLDGQELTDAMLQAEVAEVAVRCELVLRALHRPLRQRLTTALNGYPELHRDQLAEWAFDLDRLPEDLRHHLRQHADASILEPQDWSTAASHARRVTELAPDLAWAWEIVGYAAERAGESEPAKQAYRRAADCSVFTDQSIRMETHWTAGQASKFSVARLRHLCPGEVAKSSYLSSLCDPDTGNRRRATTEYCSRKALQQMAGNDFAAAHQCWVAAAWDVGAEPITAYGDLLDSIADAADRSGQRSRGEVARTHRRCLQDRYGV